ncbi:MAG: hypothetical protein ABUT20_27005 [Bacteroidota bacterium]
MKKAFVIQPLPVAVFILSCFCSQSQMVTGVWKGKINKQKVEIKIIQSGDSLTGTSYYYESANAFRRYSIKGYFDQTTNSTVWWDDQLIEEKSKYSGATGKMPLLSRADFNCPGGGVMMLDGKAALKEDNSKPRGDLHLDKTDAATFNDEWDYVIYNYTTGTNDPDIIDSIGAIAKHETVKPQPETIIVNDPPIVAETKPVTIQKPIEQTAVKTERPKEIQNPVTTSIAPSKVPTIEEKFLNRKKVFNKEIELSGDSVELRFYDNAEIDGDSISLFLNDKLIFEHIRLTEKAYIVKLAVSELNQSNELIMVAENLGSIPPNTSYMLAIVGDKRYDAYLASTEDSSAMIKFVKK